MRLLTLSLAAGFFLLSMDSPVCAQTSDNPKKNKDDVAQEKDKADQYRKKIVDALHKVQVNRVPDQKERPLENLLAEALKNNPDIRVAESKLHEAEAELNRVRLQVTQKIASQQAEITGSRAIWEEAIERRKRFTELHTKGAIPVEEFRSAVLAEAKLKADLARVEAELSYLLGAGRVSSASRDFNPTTVVIEMAEPAPKKEKGAQKKYLEVKDVFSQNQVRSSLPWATAEKIRKALDSPTPAKFIFVQSPLKEFLDSLQENAKGINFVVLVPLDKVAPVSLNLKEPVPLGAIFQFLEDQYSWRCVVREYGIVLTEPNRVPPGAIYLQDFWKNRPVPTTPPPTPAGQSK